MHRLFSLCKRIFVPAGFALVGIIMEGIIGNRADNLFTALLPDALQLIATNLLICVLLACIAVSWCIFFVYRHQQKRTDRRAMSIEKKLLALYESLVRTLTFLFLSSDIEQDAQRILVNVLHDATEIFDGRIKRAAVLVPNDTQDYLCCLVSYHMPQESIQNMNFYVGRDQHLLDAAQGVAGHAFLTRKVSGGHIELVNGSYECRDNKYYKKFVGKRSYSPYASFITIPIVSADSEAALDRAQCLGVICFDSSDKDIFDTEESKIILSRIARHAASVLTIRQRQQKKV